MKQYIYKLLLVAGALLVTNCTNDFESINTNGQTPTAASPDLLLPGVIKSSAANTGVLSSEEGLVVTQHAAMIQSTNDDIYNWDPNDQPYYRGYNSLRDIYNMIEASKDIQSLGGYYGIGLVLKTWNFAFMTDAYGDIPYAEAIQGQTNEDFFPAFSTQSDIYASMLADLETANEVLATAPSIVEGDILYDGDLSKWQKFANSLRLRLLMRISDVDYSTAIAGIQQIVNDPATYPVFESNDDNAALTHEAANPAAGYDNREGTFNVYRLSVTMENRLKALNDWRIAVFAQPITAANEGVFSANMNDYEGVPNGLGDTESESYSPYGDPNMSGSNYISKLGVMYACSECTNVSSYDAKQTLFMTYAEVTFLKAEARQRNFMTVGSAENYYQDGITASIDYYKERMEVGGWTEIHDALESMDMTAYMAQDGVAFTGNATSDLSLIYMQKWIALFHVGMEGWADWRRTNQPEVTVGSGAMNEGLVPVRFKYPNDAASFNSDNYLQAVENMGGDTLNNRMWWDTADNY